MPDGSIQERPQAEVEMPALFDRLPPEILGSLSARQRSAIASAARAEGWQAHPVNIRVSLPLLPRRWYITIVGGPERRGAERRRAERARNPLRTAGNVTFVFLSAAIFYAVVVGTVLFTSSVFEY
jgi:hypothetical protein